MAYKSFFPEKEKGDLSDIKKALDNKFSEMKNDKSESNNLIRGYFDKILQKLGTLPEDVSKMKEDIEELKNKSQENNNSYDDNTVNYGRSFDPSEYQQDDPMQKKEANKLVEKITDVLKSAGFKIKQKGEEFMESPGMFMHKLLYTTGKFIAHMYTGKVILQATSLKIPQPFRSILTKTYNTGVTILNGMTSLILKPMLMLSGMLFGMSLKPTELNMLDGMIDMLKLDDGMEKPASNNNDKDKSKEQKKEEENMFSSLGDSLAKSIGEFIFGKSDNDQRSFKDRFVDLMTSSIIAIFDTGKKAGSKVSAFFNNMFEEAFGKEGFMTKFIANLVSGTNSLIDKFMENKEFKEKIIDPIKNLWNNLKENLTDPNSPLRKVLGDMKDDLVNLIIDGVWSLIKGGGKAAKDWAINKAKSFGSNAINVATFGAAGKSYAEQKAEKDKQKEQNRRDLDKQLTGGKIYTAIDNTNAKIEENEINKDPSKLTEEQVQNLNKGVALTLGKDPEKEKSKAETETSKAVDTAKTTVKKVGLNKFLEILSDKVDSLTQLVADSAGALADQNDNNAQTLASQNASVDEADNVDTMEGK